MVLLNSEAQRAVLGESRADILRGLGDLRDRINEKLQSHERLEFLAIGKEPWTIANGFLTPTMKIRRNIIEKHYEPFFDAWFKAKTPVVWAES
jgi:long-subunit acyl-CoA synthetase (AMP-forming)